MSGGERIRLSQRSVVRCPQPRCRGSGGVQDTFSLDVRFVRRSRCCNVCGHTWSTLELPSALAKRLLALDKAIDKVNGRKKS